MGKTDIEWTEETWNPVTGCDKISQGCKHCYAEVMAKRLKAMGQRNYVNGFALTLQPHMLRIPLKRKTPTTYFANSMSDLFHEGVPFEYIAAVFGVMAATPRHTYQILTKRPERMREWFAWLAPSYRHRINEGFRAWVPGMEACAALPTQQHGMVADVPWPFPNVWLGVSVEDRKYGVPRIDELHATPAAVRFLSIEPLLEDIGTLDLTGIDWVIVGGESGHGARPMHPDWVRNIRDQVLALRKRCGATCHEHSRGMDCPATCERCDGMGCHGPALFWKQWGEYGPTGERGGHRVHRVFRDRTEWVNKASTWMVKGDEVVGMSGKLLRAGADFTPDEFPAAIVRRMGKAKAGRELDGRTWDEMPTRR